jgi:hypothetical protein
MRFELVNTRTGKTVRGQHGELTSFTDAYAAYQFEVGRLGLPYGEDPFEIVFPTKALGDDWSVSDEVEQATGPVRVTRV